MSVINSQPLIGASGNQGGAYNLTRSLRFRSSASAYLSRTVGTPTSQNTWTYSAWVKRGILSSGQQNILSSNGTQVQTLFTATDNFQFYVNNALNVFVTTQVFRDPSAWYHFVLAVDSGASGTNKVRLYVNGTEITSFSTDNRSSFSTSAINQSTTINTIGNYGQGLNNYFDGYLAEVNFVDGQQLTPSSFGETSATTGVWIPKRYAGTYGTNGFYLPFTNTASTSTLGNDFSGNGNTWTVNNVSLTSGATYDSMTDVPTLTSATAANYCVINPLINSNGVLSNGNLTYSGTAAGNKPVTLTGGFKQYAEITIGSGTASVFGLATATADMTQNTGLTTNGLYGIYDNTSGFYLFSNGTTITNISGQTSAGVVFQLAYDAPNGKLWIGKNNTWYNSSLGTTGNPSAGTNETLSSLPTDLRMFVGTGNFSTTYNVNFGQQPFAYTPPTGFVALNTFNLPTPTIGATASTQANKYFDAITYTGTGSSRSVTGYGFSPDFVWIKERNAAADHALYDSVRGVQKQLESNTTTAETTETTGLTALNSDGFTVGALAQVNTNTDTYVAWAWDANGAGSSNTAGSITSTVSANTSAGFSVARFTCITGASSRTVGHGLGVAPSMYILKCTTAGSDWDTYHVSLGATRSIQLNLTNAAGTTSTAWNNTAPTSSVFTIGSQFVPDTNSYVAYCFAPIAGYSAFGSYTGNGSTDGVFVYTGFRPKFIIRKSSTLTYGWYIDDTTRNTTNVIKDFITANTGDAEVLNDTNYAIDILSNGFKVRSSHITQNNNGATYIYMAFAESPFKYANAR